MIASFMSLFQLHGTLVYSINSTIKKIEHKEKPAMLRYFHANNRTWGRLGVLGWCFAFVAPKVDFCIPSF